MSHVYINVDSEFSTARGDMVFHVKYVIPICIGLIVFGNHYARDVVGALEKQIEGDLHLSTQEYANLNSFFFIPNMVAPFVAGLATQKMRPSLCLIIACTVAGS